MSAYTNFVSDFPERCNDILKSFVERAHGRNLEVTLMLSVASTGFVIPFERLRFKDESAHPSRDRERFREAARKLDETRELCFLDSALWGASPGSWVFAREVEDEQRELDSWPELQTPKSLTKKKKTESTLKHLRNALAHGNIFTRGDPIDRLVFLSKPCEESPKFDMLAVSPDDFYTFLQKWFSFLSSLHMPPDVYQDSMVV